MSTNSERTLLHEIKVKDEAIRLAIAILEKPAQAHADGINPALAGLTGTPRYSAGAQRLNKAAWEAMPLLRKALG